MEIDCPPVGVPPHESEDVIARTAERSPTPPRLNQIGIALPAFGDALPAGAESPSNAYTTE